MWQMKELFFKFVLQAVWRRRRELYYAVSLISIAGNLVVWVGPSVRQSSTVLRSSALQALWSALPQVTELVLHRSVPYLLLNLIVVRIVVKSGMLGRTSTTPGTPAKVDNFFLSASSFYAVRSLPWPAAMNSDGVCEMQTQAIPHSALFTDTSLWLQHAVCSQGQSNNAVDVSAKAPARMQQPITVKKSWANDKQPKRAPAPSLFTIEPLADLVQTIDSSTSKDDQAQAKSTLKHPLRKVASRRADLHSSLHTQGARARKTKDPPKKSVELAQQKDEQAMQPLLAKKNGDGGAAAEDEDYRLSGQEFNERVDTFISKFKKSLTMQRKDSFNRLLGLVGGGGDIRLIK